MRRVIPENTTISEIMDEMSRMEQMACTFYVNNSRIRIRLNAKKQ